MKRFFFYLFVALLIFSIFDVAIASACVDVNASGVSVSVNQLSFGNSKNVLYDLTIANNESYGQSISVAIKDCNTGATDYIVGDAIDGGKSKTFQGSITLNTSNYHDGDSVDFYVYRSSNVFYVKHDTIPQGWTEQSVFSPEVDLASVSYNCLTNLAKFTFSANFSLQNMSVLGVDTDSDMSEVISYSFDSSAYILTVQFTNSLTSTQHTLFVSYSGTNPDDGSSVSGSHAYSFTPNCGSQPVLDGSFYFIAPNEGQKFDNGTSSVGFELRYNGDFSSDYPDYHIHIKLVGAGSQVVKDSVPFDSNGFNGSYTSWSGSVSNLTNDTSYTLDGYIENSSGNIIRFTYVDFQIGSGSTDLKSFLKRYFDNLKNWFEDLMKRLFIPTSEQMSDLTSKIQKLNFTQFIPVISSSSTTSCLQLYNGDFFGQTIDYKVCYNSSLDPFFDIVRISIQTVLVAVLIYLIISALTR